MSGKKGKNERFSTDAASNGGVRPGRPLERAVDSAVRELQRITRPCIPEAKRRVAMPLLHNAGWMRVVLRQARDDLLSEALVIEYDNGGGQAGIRENPGFAAYNKLFASYARCIRQITDLMSGDASDQRDELAGYLDETRL